MKTNNQDLTIVLILTSEMRNKLYKGLEKIDCTEIALNGMNRTTEAQLIIRVFE